MLRESFNLETTYGKRIKEHLASIISMQRFHEVTRVNPLFIATANQDLDMVAFLLEKGANPTQLNDANFFNQPWVTLINPLHVAIILENPTMLLMLLKKTEKPDSVIYPCPQIHLVCNVPLLHFAMQATAKGATDKCATALIKHSKVNINSESRYGTALLQAIHAKHLPLAELLLACGANPNIHTHTISPLLAAMHNMPNQSNLIFNLLLNGANANTCLPSNALFADLSALMVAALKSQVVTLKHLLHHGADAKMTVTKPLSFWMRLALEYGIKSNMNQFLSRSNPDGKLNEVALSVLDLATICYDERVINLLKKAEQTRLAPKSQHTSFFTHQKNTDDTAVVPILNSQRKRSLSLG